MNVLIHCKEGDNKSASLVAAFLVYKFKINAEKALAAVKAHRPSISVSEELANELKQYEEKLHKLK